MEEVVNVSLVKDNVLSACIALVPLPVNKAFDVSEEAPVPPWVTPISVPSHVPDEIVPTPVMLDWFATCTKPLESIT